MPDIDLRFHRDMLVLSAPLDAALAKAGVDAVCDRQYLNLMEPDVMLDVMRFEALAGAQCLVSPTEDITQARLAQVRMDGDAAKLAHAALEIVKELKPQHVLAEIGPCGLPLDPFSKASLNENRAQYADAARAFADESIDAFFLNGFTSIDDLKCALMGVSQVSGRPVFASVTISQEGEAQRDAVGFAAGATQSKEEEAPDMPFGSAFVGYDYLDAPTFPGAYVRKAPLPAERWPEAVSVMEDLGAAVVGFETAEPVLKAEEYARQAAQITRLPLLAQLCVTTEEKDVRHAALTPVEDILEYTPDTLELAAEKLRLAGVQFLRATGKATPACTGALAVATSGRSVCER